MHNDPRIPTPEQYSEKLKRQEEMRHEADCAGAGQITGSQVMDKRVVMNMLHQKAHVLDTQARGLLRLADLVQATTDHDYPLFTTILAMVKT